MLRSDFVKEYMAVQQDSFKEQTLLQAWKKSGAWPINPNIFIDEDFALSIPFSTHACNLPAMFPLSNSEPLTILTPANPDNLFPNSDIDLESDSSFDSDSKDGNDVRDNNNNRQTVPPLPLSLPPLHTSTTITISNFDFRSLQSTNNCTDLCSSSLAVSYFNIKLCPSVPYFESAA